MVLEVPELYPRRYTCGCSSHMVLYVQLLPNKTRYYSASPRTTNLTDISDAITPILSVDANIYSTRSSTLGD
ncbi:hypothetical protein PAT3040_05450 [Paenibacillus agaridevorans]|uniref:Uncharacterized protein n=1 Tax=Paenibacillus agaridevorans TaxID=171404 RepID=A0A2R5F029_9BACL|nr:hypothetical protein PAT3040_05450 [Paenibacillus agaridevorans]